MKASAEIQWFELGKHSGFRIMWSGVCGKKSADVLYRTREIAVAMAQLCGADKIK